MLPVSLCFWCAAHPLDWLLIDLSTSNNFVQFVFAEIPRESDWWGPLQDPLVLAASPVIAIYQNWNQILGLRYPRPCYLVPEVLVIYFLCFVYKKIHWSLHGLADTVAPFLTIWLFYQNWVLTEVLICPIYILHAFILLDNSITFLSSRFVFSVVPVFSIVASQTIHILRTSLLSFHTWTVSSLFQNTGCSFLKCLASCSRSGGMPLLALIEPETLALQSGNVSVHLTLL